MGHCIAFAQTSNSSNRPTDEVLVKLEQKCLPRLTGEMWTLTHAYESKDEVDKVLAYLADIAKSSQTVDQRLGGAESYKNTFSKFLDSKDEAVRAFSAIALACTGDKSFAPRLAKIVNERDESFTERFAPGASFVRGRSAVALGLMQATEYKSDIARLLKSKNEYDRSGAISALIELNAIEFTGEIVSLLANKDLAFDDDDSPIYFLIETKQVGKYKKEIVQAMLGQSHMKVSESATYALAAIGAKEHARDVARLLKNEFRQGCAAKALALMGASEYSGEIAKLLSAKSGLTRNAAMVSLAILDSKKHIQAIVRIYNNDPKIYVKPQAAVALLLLGKPQYYREIKLETALKEPPKLSELDFHYFVLEKLKPYNEKLLANLNSQQTNR